MHLEPAPAALHTMSVLLRPAVPTLSSPHQLRRSHHHADWTCSCSPAYHELAAQASGANAQLTVSAVRNCITMDSGSAPAALEIESFAAQAGDADTQLTWSAGQGPACSLSPAAPGCSCAGTASAWPAPAGLLLGSGPRERSLVQRRCAGPLRCLSVGGLPHPARSAPLQCKGGSRVSMSVGPAQRGSVKAMVTQCRLCMGALRHPARSAPLQCKGSSRVLHELRGLL